MKNLLLKFLCPVLIGILGPTIAYSQEAAGHKPAEDYIQVYQKYLSGVKNFHCSMNPTCSNYAKMVFRDHSFPTAMALAADRIIRCSHDLKFYPTTYRFEYPVSVDYPSTRIIPKEVLSENNAYPVYISNVRSPGEIYSRTTDFVAFLINQRNYEGALYEIDKSLHHDSTAYPQLYAYKLKCFEGLHRYEDGIYAYELLYPDFAKENYATLFNVAHLYDLMGDADVAIKYFESAKTQYSPASLMAHPYNELGILYVKTGQYDKARAVFQKKFQEDNQREILESNFSIIRQAESAKRKKKNVAMALSIVPGGGYFYTKHPQSALTAILMNGILGYATYTSFKSHNDGLGIILGALTLSFYIGNIHGSGSSADRYNANIERRATDELRSINPFIN